MAFLSTSPAVPDQAGLTRVARVTITFTGAANLGAVGNLPLFTVSGGLIAIEEIYGRCTTNLASAGAGTLTLGVTGQTALFIGVTTATTLTTAAELWVSTTATAAGILIPAADKQALIDANVVGTVATGAITSGVLEIDCLWHPISAGATLA